MDRKNTHIDSISKVNYALLEHLSKMFNIKFNYIIESSWGSKNNKSEWDGMVGYIIRKDADIGGTPLFFTMERVSRMEYIALTVKSRNYFVFRQPNLSYIKNVFTLPFTTQVWLAIIALVIVTCLALYCVMRWEFNKQKYTLEKNILDQKFTIVDGALISFGALCQQGPESSPRSVPGKIIIFILYISLMFLYTSYSANIVALLQSPSSNIQTLEDLLKSRFELGVQDIVFNRVLFPLAKEPVRKAMYDKKIAPPGEKPNFLSLVDGVKKIRKGHFAFHMAANTGYQFVERYFLENEKCGLKEIQYYESNDAWIAMAKNSSFKELLKIGFKKTHETGIQNRESAVIYRNKPKCMSSGSSFISIGLTECYAPILVLAIGVIASLSIFIIEVVFVYKFRRIQKM